MKWSNNYQIGDQQLDEQHKQLILTTEELLKAINSPDIDSKEECRKVMNFLKNYVVVHFNTEEMMMEKIGFPGIEHHKQLHRKFKEDMRQLEMDLMREDYPPELIKQTADTLTRWWIFHIMREDKKLGPYLKKANEDASK